tara:strand:+ start:1698 stop:2408 length:711 start_codon:yes stop_codon:yes gene_type:complete
MKEVIAMHGWGGDSNSWQIWDEYFCNKKWAWQSVERGYGEKEPFSPIWSEPPSKDSHTKRVVIAHSLGLHLIDNQILSKATDVVLLSSFSSFIPDGKENRSLKTALAGMQKHLGTTKEKNMLKNFLLKACQPESPQKIQPGPITRGLSIEGREKLIADLKLLIATQTLPEGLSTHARVLVIQGQEDSIVVPSSRKTLINDLESHLDHAPTNWMISGAGHLLLIPELKKHVHHWLSN